MNNCRFCSKVVSMYDEAFDQQHKNCVRLILSLAVKKGWVVSVDE